jgi:metallophosphoesterase (TIGR03768 family)
MKLFTDKGRIIQISVIIALCIIMVIVPASAAVPAAGFTGTPVNGTVPLTVSFTDGSTGSPDGWAWFFGDETYAQAWMRINAGAPWPVRYGHSSVVMQDGTIVLMGGVNDVTGLNNSVWQSEDEGASWTEVNASAGWAPRYAQSGVLLQDGSILVMGGFVGTAGPSFMAQSSSLKTGFPNPTSIRNDVWRSTDGGRRWTQLTNSTAWSPRAYQEVVVMPDHSIVMMAGADASGPKNDTWRSTDGGITWTEMSSNPGWSARSFPSAVAMPDGSIVLTGGEDHAGVRNDAWRSTDNGASWTRMNASSGWSPRYGHDTVAMPDGSIILTGGFNGYTAFSNDVWRSTNEGASWTRVNANPGWSPRFGHTTVAMPDGSIILAGGGNGGLDNDVWRLQPAGSLAESPSHVYTVPGNYAVTLQAFNDEGYTSLTRSSYITAVPRLATPVFTSIVPAGAWYRNATVNYTITGRNFQPGNTAVTFQNRSGLYLNGTDAGVTLVTSTAITGQIHVPANAPAGAWNISITTTDGGTAWKDSAFTVQAVAKPTITSIVPAGIWYRNATVNYTITGTNFLPGNTAATFRNKSGLYLNGTDAGLTLINATTIAGQIHIPFDAPSGAWNISVTTPDGGTVWKDSAFTVQSVAKPTVTSVVPAGIWYRNATISYSITGTNFLPGKTIVTFWNRSGTLLNATSTGMSSVTPTKINGTILIPANAPTATPYNITVTTTDGGTGGMNAAFTVMQFPAPVIASITPVTGSRNTSLAFTLTGGNLQPAGGYTNISVVNQFTGEKIYGRIVSATNTKATGTFAVPALSTGGTYDLVVTTVDGGSATKESAFTVNAFPLPVVSAINLTSGYRNTTVPFLITGNNFQPDGGTWVRLYSTTAPQIDGILTNVTGPKMSGTFTIPYNAGTGKYRLDVFTVSGGGGSRLNAFTVNPLPAPTVSSVLPADSYRNRTFVITATGTNFQPDGLTLMTVDLISPANLYYNVSLISATTTRLNGTVTVPANATTATGWKLNITTKEGGRASKPSAIIIKAFPAPGFTKITPATAYSGGTVSFTLGGTNLEAGGTNVTLWNRTGNTVLVPDILWSNATMVIGSITIPSVTDQSWYVNISTVDGGSVGAPKAFTVITLPDPSYPIDTTVVTTTTRTIAIIPNATHALFPYEMSSYAQYGYGKWKFGPPLPVPKRQDILDPAYDNTSVVHSARLLNYFTMSDVHITDEESPVSAIFFGYKGGTSSAYSPVMMYTTQVLDAVVQTINAMHKQKPFDFGISLGDVANSDQYNELRWYIDTLDGKVINPDSGIKNDPVPGPLNDYQDQFKAAGLNSSINWYQTLGNHDHFYTGFLPPNVYFSDTLTGKNIINLGLVFNDPLGMNSRGFYMGSLDGRTPLGNIVGVGPVSVFSTPPQVEAADPNRHSLSVNQWMGEFLNSSSNPPGHGFNQSMVDAGFACYTFDPKADIPIRVIVLDDTQNDNDPTNPDSLGFGHGELDAARYNWLVSELDRGQAENKLMIIAAHVPIGVLPDGQMAAWNPTSPVNQSQLMDQLHSHPNFMLWMAGHLHLNQISAFNSTDPSHPEQGFWEVQTPSLRDYPQQFRTFEILRNSDDTVSIIVTDVDPAVREGTPAAQSRSYGVAAQEIFINPLSPMPNGTANAELIKELSPAMKVVIHDKGTPL